MNGRATVDPATVLVTASGAMEGSRGQADLPWCQLRPSRPRLYPDRSCRSVREQCAQDIDRGCSVLLTGGPSCSLMATRSRKGTVLDDRCGR